MKNKGLIFIEKGINEVREQGYDLPDSHLLAIWAIGIIHYEGRLDQSALDDIYAHTHALYAESPNSDCGLDAYHFDREESKLYLYQFEYSQSPNKAVREIGAMEVVAALKSLYADLCRRCELPEARRDAADALEEVIDKRGRIHLRGVTTGKWPDGYQEQIRLLLPRELQDLVEVQLLCPEWFIALRDSWHNDLQGKPVDFQLLPGVEGPLLIIPEGTEDGIASAYTGVISAFSMADVAAKWQDRLYDKNVRRHLGYKTRVNGKILESISTEEGRRLFWYGHNGITVLCDAFSHDKSTGMLTVENPQVVNGCQTMKAIELGVGPSDQRRNPQVDFGILARFIELKGSQSLKSDIANDIALKTNTQEKVTSADLKSNDRVQRLFSQRLQSYEDGWFYVRKRGDWRRVQKDPILIANYREDNNDDRRIEPQLYQQAWRAYIGRPANSIDDKGGVWETNGLYEDVFCEDRRACDIVLASILLDWFAHVFFVKSILNENNEFAHTSLATDIHPGLDLHLPKLEKARMRCAAHALALFGKMVEAAYKAHAAYPETHISSIVKHLKRGNSIKAHWVKEGPDKSWWVLSDAFMLIFRTIGHFCRQEVDKVNELKRSDVTLYGLLKRDSEKSLEIMWDDLRTERQFEFKYLVTPKVSPSVQT